ncbi:MAG: phosphoenolpyruvate--protein phosphotransferase [Calditrichae bacterium]|nr:phosphoenolpyruvate--protein phosphotransferase [Calditrichota bacterium]MCB9059349.1 phosphoenolpyruvate--protein phosphotransferase [Calditrichia bacterium]
MKSKTRQKQVVIKGQATAPGIAIGRAFLFKPFEINLAELNSTAEDVKQEINLFLAARDKVMDRLDFARKQSIDSYDDQFSQIFESQISFLNDPVLIDEIRTKIKQDNYSAVYAVSRILSQKSDHFINLENTYFRERAFDIIDLKQQLLLALLGIKIDYHLTAPSVIVAENLSPADTINFNRNFILGFLTDHGGYTSHSSILARGLRIPSVVNGKQLSTIITDYDELIVDGFEGTIIINPDKSTLNRYAKIKKEHEKHAALLESLNKEEAVTLDNESITLLANIEFAQEVNDVIKYRADGVGLFRTEAMFLEKSRIPNEEQQFKVYKKIASGLSNKPFIIRTVDLGGDKLMEGYTDKSEQNPFLGWRAIRYCLDNPEIFKMQIRAIIKAAQYGTVKLLIPMVNSVGEILQTKEYLAEAMQEVREAGAGGTEKIEIGIMVETPAAAIMSDTLAKYVDFMSIGSNDLTQYTLAVDRTNSKVAKSYNPFDPAVLELMHITITSAKNNNIPVSICGEFAGVQAAVPLLLGMGLRSLSVAPHTIPVIKKIIRSVNIESCIKLYEKIQTFHHASEIEDACIKYLNKNIPELSFS